MLQTFTHPIHTQDPKINADGLSTRFGTIVVLESNDASNPGIKMKYRRLIALGSCNELVLESEKGALDKLRSFCSHHNDWIFGYLSYDLKNDIESLSSKNDDHLKFPALHFFVPQMVICQDRTGITVHYQDNFISPEEAKELTTLCFSRKKNALLQSRKPEIQAKMRRSEYLEAVMQLKEHIRKGDIYEVNFCQEFFAKNATIYPVTAYEKLNAISSAPFTVYGKFGKHHILSASPERFLQKTGNTLISQPIKGTARRSEDPAEDERLKNALFNDKKERSENVMIVDLVRNDLSHIAKKGSVNAGELFAIYSFKQVHQMISTVSCELKDDLSVSDILKATFPMGSMTGAPKISAMNLIEKYEKTKRGLYSGAIGYIAPNGDFDFNVVIRSILYNAENNYLSFMVGSAITDGSVPEKEYEECLLKAKAMFEVLQDIN